MISSDLPAAVGTTASNRSESEGGDRQKPADCVEKSGLVPMAEKCASEIAILTFSRGCA